MAWHTLSEAVKLTGRSKRSIYRDMDAGRVTFRKGRGGQREFDTAELIRVYGELHAEVVEQPPEQPAAAQQPATAEDMARVLDELRAVRAELAELREGQKLLTYQPEPQPRWHARALAWVRRKAGRGGPQGTP